MLRNFHCRLLAVTLAVACWTLLFETVKQIVRPNITIWQSHTATIAFSATVATVAAYFAFRRYETLMLRLMRENDRRKEIERELRVSQSKQQELLDALKEADRRKDQFLAMLSHELRNPLTPIRTTVGLLKHGPADPLVKKCTEIIDRQAAHLVRITDDLLDISRITRGKIELRKEYLDFAKLARETIEDYRMIVERAGLTFVAELPSDPVWVHGDYTRLVQVLSNLINNATKFTKRGDRISISMRVSDSEPTVVTTISDTGIGMSPETQSHIFDPFSQANNSRGGLGLGLALVKGLIELHGGDVHGSSDGPGQGSQFVLRIPIGTEMLMPKAELAEVLATASRRVLIIDDQTDIVDSIRGFMEYLGHQVRTETNGASGIQAAREFRPEIVFCDLGLSDGMDGYAVAKILRADPAFNRAYLVAISGYGRAEDKKKAREAGFDMHLTKPVESSAFERILAGYRNEAVQT